MDIIIIIVIFAAVSYFRNKKKREEAEQKRRSAIEAQQQPSAAQGRFQAAYSVQQPAARVFDPRFPDYQPPQRQQKPAPDPRFPDLDDMFTRGVDGLRNKLNAVSDAVTDAQARNLKEQLDEINRRKQETQRRRKDAPVLRSHMESNVENHMESKMESLMDAPPIFRLDTTDGREQEWGEGPPPKRNTQARQPRPAPVKTPVQPLYQAIASMSRDRNALANSIVMGEILGRPKALRH